MIALMAATIACGALCGVLLGFPWAARFALAAPLTLLPLLYAYRSKGRAACAWLTLLYTAAQLLVGLLWIYVGAGTNDGPAEYYASAIALLFVCAPFALVGFAASFFSKLPAPQWCVAIASLWALGEYWRATAGFGVPYAQLGHALIDTPLVALARIGGTEALTFACVLAAAAIFELATGALRFRIATWALCGVVIALNAAAFNVPPSVAALGTQVAVFQFGLIDANTTLWRYLDALRTLPPMHGFAVWPESGLDLNSGTTLETIRSAVAARRVPLLVGGTITDASGLHDALLLLEPDGSPRGYYAKRRLIPFGEYLPWPTLAHFVLPAAVIDAAPNLSSGAGPVTFAIGDRVIGPLICYESAFPGLARDEVRIGANLLVAATNDVWFAQASGFWELTQTARLVAIETGTPMVLAGTVGPSGLIDADGRWTGSLPVNVLARGVFSAPPAHPTIYDAVGDVPVLVALAILGLLAVGTASLRRR